MILDELDLEMCATVQEILELCIDVLKKQLTDNELQDMDDEHILYHLMLSAKACLLHVHPKGDWTEDEAFMLVASYYMVVCEFALQLARTSLLSRSLSSNGNGSIKAISSNGRSVTFATSLDMLEQSQLPQSIKDKLPRPKTQKVRVW